MEEIKIPKFDYEYEMVDDLGNLYAPKDDGITAEELEFVEAKIAELEGDVRETELAVAPITLMTRDSIQLWAAWREVGEDVSEWKAEYINDSVNSYEKECIKLNKYIRDELSIIDFMLSRSSEELGLILSATNVAEFILAARIELKYNYLRPLEWKNLEEYKIERTGEELCDNITRLKYYYEKYKKLLIDVKNSEWAKPESYE